MRMTNKAIQQTSIHFYDMCQVYAANRNPVVHIDEGEKKYSD